MSYLCFGTIEYKKEYSEATILDDLAWRIFQAGIQFKLFVLFYPIIPQKIVNEMIVEQCNNNELRFRFLITSSPTCDTSDALISPPFFGESDLASVLKNISLFEKWIKAIINYDGVEMVNLFLTEGYDDNFKLIKVSTDNMLIVMKNEISEYGDIPSLRIEIKK